MSAVRPCRLTLHSQLLSVKLHPKRLSATLPPGLPRERCSKNNMWYLYWLYCDATRLVFKCMQNHHCIVWHNRYNIQHDSITSLSLHTWMSVVRPWHSATLPPGLHYILVWYSRSVHPEKWHALYDVNACENHDPGKWQAMHATNACETTLRLYCDDSHLISSVCEIINVVRHSRLVIVDCL